jgi:surface antigen
MYQTYRLIAVIFFLFALADESKAYSPNPYDNNPILIGECTWYAYKKWPQIDQPPPSTGNGFEWLDDAQRKGYSTGSKPEVGAIAVWDAWVGGTRENGHVAYVEKVYSDTYFKVSEYNWNPKAYSERNVTKISGINFIYPGGGGTSPSPTESPDFTVREVYLGSGNTTFSSCSQFPERIYARIKNKGDGDADKSIRIEYYLSNGEKVDSAPQYIGHDDIDEKDLESGESEWEDKGFNVPTAPGTYNLTVCADTEDRVDEEHESNNCLDPPFVFQVVQCNQLPHGHIDNSSCQYINGWARDPDTTAPIAIHFYANGIDGADWALIGATTADQYRPDVGAHGFSFQVPEQLLDGSFHSVHVYAIDHAGGPNPLIGKTGVICVQPTSIGEPVYRFYHNSLGFHFYTISEDEKNYILNTWPDDWAYEGIAWYAYSSLLPGASPVHRFIHNTKGFHFYTISEEEKKHIIETWPDDWSYEGIAWYAYESPVSGTLPVYRFIHNTLGFHFYTISEEEKNHILNTWPDDWSLEGVAWNLRYDHSIKNALSEKSFSEISADPIFPKCQFSANLTSGKLPLKVSFLDESEGDFFAKIWDFGDNSTSSEDNPTHIYENSGTYSVKLTVSGPDGSQTIERTNYISVRSPTIEDVIAILQFLTGNNDLIEISEQDWNQDGKVGIEDALFTLRQLTLDD